jgi:hypothetical protein
MARRVAGVKPSGAAIVRRQASPLIKPNRLPYGNAPARGQREYFKPAARCLTAGSGPVTPV